MRSAKNVLILGVIVIVSMIWSSRVHADEFTQEDLKRWEQES